jgi:hypothetical protein
MMRSILVAACFALGAAGAMYNTPVRAEVDVRVPGVRIETGGDRHDDDWRRREEIRREHERHCEHDRDCRR